MDATIVVAVVTGIFGVLITYLQVKTHREVRTNHGVRAGQRIENLGDDIAQIKRTMVTQQDLQEHAAHDIEVAEALAKDTKETREIILAAIRLGGK